MTEDPYTDPEAENNLNRTPGKKPPPPRLFKPLKGRLILGVCAAYAEYFTVDPIIIRLIFIISLFFGFWGAIIYIVSAILIPSEQMIEDTAGSAHIKPRNSIENPHLMAGTVLVILGAYLLVRNTGLLSLVPLLGSAREYFLPVLLLASGFFLLNTYRPKATAARIENTIYREQEDRLIFGVCAGLARYLNAGPSLIRIVWIMFTIISLGLGFLLYALFYLVLPLRKQNPEGLG